MADKYGAWFTWSGSPRAKIFARDHNTVKDVPSMIKLMRWAGLNSTPLNHCMTMPNILHYLEL